MDPNLLSFPSLLSIPGVSLSLLSNIFAEATIFYKLAPWKLLREEIPIEIRYPQAEPARVVVVMGAAGDVFGISVYDSAEDLIRMFRTANPADLLRNLSWLTLCYEPSAYFAAEDLAAIAEHGWQIANKAAYPSINRMGSPSAELHSPTIDDMLWLEGALPALNRLFQEDFQLDGGGEFQPQEFTMTVQTSSGSGQVYLRIPVQGVSIRPGG